MQTCLDFVISGTSEKLPLGVQVVFQFQVYISADLEDLEVLDVISTR